MQQELDSVVPPGRLPSLEDRSKLPYVDATVLEIMRRHTLAPLSIPRRTTTDTHVDHFFVPAGTMVPERFKAFYLELQNQLRFPFCPNV